MDAYSILLNTKDTKSLLIINFNSKMKTLITLFIVSIMALVGCNKKTTAPSPTPSTNTSTMSLTAQDSSLLGNWILDKKEYIANGVMQPNYPQNFNDPINARIEFKATGYTGGAGQNWKECINGIWNTGIPAQQYWYMTSSTTINISNQYYTINSISSTNLILQWGSINSPGTAGYIYYLHK